MSVCETNKGGRTIEKVFIIKYEKESPIGGSFIDSIWDSKDKALERYNKAREKYPWNIYWIEDWNVNEEE